MGSSKNVKQVILARDDLNMRKGKLAAQVAHASVAVCLELASLPKKASQRVPFDLWMEDGHAKIVLGVLTEEELVAAYKAAKAAGIPATLITDSGTTEFRGVPTKTVVSIGPWWTDDIDLITGKEGIIKTKLL